MGKGLQLLGDLAEGGIGVAHGTIILNFVK